MKPKFFRGSPIPNVGVPVAIITFKEKKTYYTSTLFCLLDSGIDFDYVLYPQAPIGYSLYKKDEDNEESMIMKSRQKAEKHIAKEFLDKVFHKKGAESPKISLQETDWSILLELIGRNKGKIKNIHASCDDDDLRKWINRALATLGDTEIMEDEV